MVTFGSHAEVHQIDRPYPPSGRYNHASASESDDDLSARKDLDYQTPRTTRRRRETRRETVYDTMKVFMDADDDDVDVSRLRGFSMVGMLGLSIVSFLLGVCLPLVEITAFPGSHSMEVKVTSSLKEAIINKFKDAFLAGLVCLIFIVILPMLEFLGAGIIIFDNFFAKGFDECCDGKFSKGLCCGVAERNAIVDYMTMTSSYLVISPFFGVFIVGFFSSGATAVICGWGFYCYCFYNLIMILMLQIMEVLKEPPEDEDEDDDPRSSRKSTMTATKSWQGKRRRLSSFFPELPGTHGKMNDVDGRQIFLLTAVFVFLLTASLDQPLLSLHVAFEGFVFQRKELTLRELCDVLKHWSPFGWFIFVVLVFVIPLLYCMFLIATAVLSWDMWKRFNPNPRLHDGALWLASLLRPWAMTDVFALCLFLYAYSAQDDYVVTLLPDGILQWPSILPSDVGKEQRNDEDSRFWGLNGTYLFIGAGIAMFIMRWFWQMGDEDEPEDPERNPMESMTSSTTYNDYTTLPPTRARQGADAEVDVRTASRSRDGILHKPLPTETKYKCIFGIGVWLFVALVLWLLMTQYHLDAFSEKKLNHLIQKHLPKMNKWVRNKLPATLGSCADGTFVPTPCKEEGKLYHTVQDAKRIAIPWITGLNTLHITDLSVVVTEDPLADSEIGEQRRLQDDCAELMAMTKGALIKRAVTSKVDNMALAKAAAGTKEDLIEAILRKENKWKGHGCADKDGNATSEAEVQTTVQRTSTPEAGVKATVQTTSTSQVATTTVATTAPWTTPPQTTSARQVGQPRASPSKGGHPRYTFVVAGVFKTFNLYLHVDMCDKCPTHDTCIGCKNLVASNTTCCHPNRAFRIELLLQCDDHGVPSMVVHKFHLDSLVISASANLIQHAGESVAISLPDKDITKQVHNAVTSQLTGLLTKKKLVEWGGEDMNFQQILKRMVRFSAEDKLFQC